MGLKSPSRLDDQFPGPGNYDPNRSLVEIRSPLGNINPLHSASPGRQMVPGPGHYSPQHKLI